MTKLISITPDAEATMAFIARVSNPKNQENEDYAKLLAHCAKNQHWSVFEHAYMTIEVETSLSIAPQILRHRSFTFQQFSQRYASSKLLANSIEIPNLRRQDKKNRQSSIDDLPEDMISSYEIRIKEHFENAMELYNSLLKDGVAKECARFVLPTATKTKLYITGSCRSWIHYIELRSGHGTQKEHMDIAGGCRKIFIEQFPSTAEALNWIV